MRAPKVLRAAGCAPIEAIDDLSTLVGRGFRLAALVATGGRPPWEVPAAPVALADGGAPGPPRGDIEQADLCITIPGSGGTLSLNGAGWLAIVAYEVTKRAPNRCLDRALYEPVSRDRTPEDRH
ncbi:MAG: hypothetical protein ACRDVM_09245 [Acidimicrobiia bacterium]